MQAKMRKNFSQLYLLFTRFICGPKQRPLGWKPHQKQGKPPTTAKTTHCPDNSCTSFFTAAHQSVALLS